MSLLSVDRTHTAGQTIGTLVLLHGLGADELDLMGIAVGVDDRLRVVSLRAPFRYAVGGFSWFDIELGEQSLKIDCEMACHSLAVLAERLVEIPKPILLTGFSQGAMMAIGICLEFPDTVQGVIAMSGGWIPCFDAKGRIDVPILVTHGKDDPVVPYEFGQSSAQRLVELGASVDFRGYQMEHEITPTCLSDISNWTDAWISRIPSD